MVMVMVIHSGLFRSHQSTSAGSFGLVRKIHALGRSGRIRRSGQRGGRRGGAGKERGNEAWGVGRALPAIMKGSGMHLLPYLPIREPTKSKPTWARRDNAGPPAALSCRRAVVVFARGAHQHAVVLWTCLGPYRPDLRAVADVAAARWLHDGA